MASLWGAGLKKYNDGGRRLGACDAYLGPNIFGGGSTTLQASFPPSFHPLRAPSCTVCTVRRASISLFFPQTFPTDCWLALTCGRPLICLLWLLVATDQSEAVALKGSLGIFLLRADIAYQHESQANVDGLAVVLMGYIIKRRVHRKLTIC